ncbi:MAG: molecular chaperone DnaJ [Mariniblastus sp.]|jgi:molecular chaperone DnaJ
MSSTLPLNEDLYKILGVSKDATEKEIQRAYRKLALKFHPDRNQDDADAADKFKKASEAYEILKDSKKRKAYDSGGMSGVDQTGHEGFANNEEIYARYGDLFGDLFGNQVPQRRAGPARGQDLRFVLTIDFMIASLGGKKTIDTPIPVTCDQCLGHGILGKKANEPCEICHGQGQIARQTAEHGGYFTVASPCPGCSGTGRRGTPCDQCHGEGRVESNRTITVTIPAGIKSDQVLRLRAQGQAGLRGGAQGDLLIEIKIQPHATFVREGQNIRSDVRVPLATALLSGKVDVLTLRGTVSMTIPAGTSSDRVLRIRGQGIDAKGKKGDHLVRVVLEVPKKTFTEPEQENLRQLLKP